MRGQHQIRNAFFWVVLGLLFHCLCPLQGCRCQEKVEPNVAVVDGVPISFQAFWDEFKSRYDQVADPSTLQSEVLLRMKTEVLSDLIRRRLLLQEARSRQIRIPEKQLNERIERIRAGYPGLAFRRVLLEYRQDEEQFRRTIEEQMMMEQLYRDVVAGVEPVTDEEVGAYYDDHLDAFLVPETVRMRQLLVKDLKQARNLLWEARNGKDFSELAAEHGLDPEEGEDPGRVMSYGRGELPEALEAAAFSAEKGRVTGPVETPYGFFLIWVEDRVPAHLPALEEVREEIAGKLRREREEEAYARWMRQRIRDARVEVHESLRAAMQEP